MQNKKIKAKNSIYFVLVAIVFFFLGGYFSKTHQLPSEKVQDVYGKEPGFELNGGSVSFEDFWEVWNLLNEKHPEGESVGSQEKVWSAISGLVDSVGDPYTSFFTPKEAEDLDTNLNGEFFGVGMEVGVRDGLLTVISPLKDSPAEKAGLLAGDKIIEIDGFVASKMTIDEAIDLIRGEKGTDVNLTIIREGEAGTKEVSVTRDLIKIPNIEAFLREDGVFVINLFSFSKNSQKEFEGALSKFAESRSNKLLLDLRNNPGGFLSSAIDIASWFVPTGDPIVTERGKEGSEEKIYRSRGHSLGGNFDMVVLVNGGSASASEILAGALQEYGVAELVGTQTFGKGSVQELIRFDDGTELKITIAKWLTPGGISITENGLTPDYVVEFTEDDFENGIDPQLDKALEILLSNG